MSKETRGWYVQEDSQALRLLHQSSGSTAEIIVTREDGEPKIHIWSEAEHGRDNPEGDLTSAHQVDMTLRYFTLPKIPAALKFRKRMKDWLNNRPKSFAELAKGTIWESILQYHWEFKEPDIDDDTPDFGPDYSWAPKRKKLTLAILLEYASNSKTVSFFEEDESPIGKKETMTLARGPRIMNAGGKIVGERDDVIRDLCRVFGMYEDDLAMAFPHIFQEDRDMQFGIQLEAHSPKGDLSVEYPGYSTELNKWTSISLVIHAYDRESGRSIREVNACKLFHDGTISVPERTTPTMVSHLRYW